MQEKIINTYRIAVTFLLMTISGSIALALRLLSAGALTDFNRRYLIPFSCRLTLWLVGIKLQNRVNLPKADRPNLYTFNHNSYLDGFVLMCLGLTNTRFLLSEKMLVYLPLTITALSIGVLFIPRKKYKERRLKFFLRLEKRIKKEKVSIAGSSEGVHDFFHGITEFNRGVYHTAMACEMPVVAIFIYTPIESNPFNDFRPFKNGTVRMELIDIVSTHTWKPGNLDAHINDVRSKFVEKFNSCHEIKTT